MLDLSKRVIRHASEQSSGIVESEILSGLLMRIQPTEFQYLR